METTAEELNISLARIPPTLDSGFDSAENVALIKNAGMIPVIRPNFRNAKDTKIMERREKEFKKSERTHRLRHAVELNGVSPGEINTANL